MILRHSNFVSLSYRLILLLLLRSSLRSSAIAAVNESISSSHSLINNHHQNHIFTTNRPQHYDFCGPPPNILHAQCNLLQNQRHNVFKVGEIATYVCETGFKKVSGHELLKCLPRDEMGPPRWETDTIKCEIVVCGDPGFVANATRSVGTFDYNTNVEFKCAVGFRMIGVPFLTCKSDGRWNREKPICQLKQCSKLSPLPNGRIIYSDIERRSSSKAEYHCDFGYKFNFVHSIRFCRDDDSWSSLSDMSDANPECTFVTCDIPIRPHSGLRIINTKKSQKQYRPGDFIIYRCHNGVTTTSKCLPDGQWGRGPPHCPTETLCPPFNDSEHRSYNGSKPFRVNTVIAFKCEDNYILEGQPLLTCLMSGKWNNKEPKCAFNSELHKPETSSQLTILISSIIVLSLIVLFISSILICRWRQQKLERRRWQRYFGNYNHRQSKTNITLNSNEMKCFRQSPKPTVPVTDL